MHEHDGVVVATHADEALSLLAMPTNEEKSILGAFSYQMNRAVVHSDSSLMPRHKSVWSAWNVLSTNNQEAPVSVTYWMNKLQNLNSSKNFFVSLNPISEPRIGATERILKYDHPIFDVSAVSAQTKLQMLQGIGNIWFCGSYFGYGFHEDALRSGLEIAELLGVKRPWNPEYKTRKSNRISKTETLVLEISNG
jgi:predicted NAD/FAD-binding protein